MKSESITIETLKAKCIPVDYLQKNKNGTYTLMKSFYWRSSSPEKIAQKLKEEFPEVEIVNLYTNFVPFKGGDSIKKGSHYGVEFKFPQ